MGSVCSPPIRAAAAVRDAPPQPPVHALDANATTRGTYNDIAYDSSNRLHMVYADRDTGNLLYAVRNTAGNWSVPQIIDSAASSDAARMRALADILKRKS